MYHISRQAKTQLVKAYKAYFEMVVKNEGSKLTVEERKAVGQKVLEDILVASFNKLDIPQQQQRAFREEFEELIRKEFPDSLLYTPLKFTGKFSGKAFEDKSSSDDSE